MVFCFKDSYQMKQWTTTSPAKGHRAHQQFSSHQVVSSSNTKVETPCFMILTRCSVASRLKPLLTKTPPNTSSLPSFLLAPHLHTVAPSSSFVMPRRALSSSSKLHSASKIPPPYAQYTRFSKKWWGEVMLIMTVFAISGSTTMAIVRPALHAVGVEGESLLLWR
jgi:hypothetical protein